MVIVVCSNTLVFTRGTVSMPSVITMSELSNITDAMKLVGRNNLPPNIVSSFIMVDPPNTFPGSLREAQIELDLDNQVTSAAGVSVYRASEESDWIFERLDTSTAGGLAMAQTSQGGLFVASSKVDTGLVVGVVVAILILLVIAILVAGVIIYFRARPDKFASVKSSLSKTPMKLKRSFAREV